MKDSEVGVVLVVVLVVAMGSRSAGYTGPGLHQGFALQASDNLQALKRGFWDKRADDLHQQQETTDLQHPLQEAWRPAQQTLWSRKQEAVDKRGFGSMMPAYLVQLYRPEQPLINPSALFTSSRTIGDRDRTDYSNRG
nr:uncharacterized protein LOC123773449 isoform X2 [Procambarus clarkii]